MEEIIKVDKEKLISVIERLCFEYKDGDSWANKEWALRELELD